MAVTDLTNTLWVINDSYSPSPYTSKEFYINFTTEGDLSFVGIEFNKSTTYGGITYIDNILYDNGSGTSIFVAVNGGATWEDNSYKTVHISGGTDATNSSLISWFEANATQVLPPEYIDKVVLPSEEEYNIKDTISGYLKGSDLVAGTNISIEETSEGQLEISSTDSGIAARIIKLSEPEISLAGTTWYFNEHLQSLTPIGLYDITFINNNREYIKIGNSSTYPDDILYRSSSGTTYAYEAGWILQSYRTINITGGTDSTNSGFIAWLEANATQVS